MNFLNVPKIKQLALKFFILPNSWGKRSLVVPTFFSREDKNEKLSVAPECFAAK